MERARPPQVATAATGSQSARGLERGSSRPNVRVQGVTCIPPHFHALREIDIRDTA